MESLFDSHAPRPLADKLRPQTLDDVLGQQHLLGPGCTLHRLLADGRITSIILWGPPGTGKTTTVAKIVEKLFWPNGYEGCQPRHCKIGMAA